MAADRPLVSARGHKCERGHRSVSVLDQVQLSRRRGPNNPTAWTRDNVGQATIGIIKKFLYCLRSVLRTICVGFVLGNCAVCVEFVWGFHSMYCPFTVHLIIRYRNSGTL